MKCLSLWQPWATLMVIGAKHFETRSWQLRHRGPLLIHAAKKQDRDSLELCLEEPFRSALVSSGIEKIGDLPFGAIIGSVDVLDCVRSLGGGLKAFLSNGHTVCGPEREFGDYSPGRWISITRNPRRFLFPLAFRGLQLLFDVPDQIIGDVASKGIVVPKDKDVRPTGTTS